MREMKGAGGGGRWHGWRVEHDEDDQRSVKLKTTINLSNGSREDAMGSGGQGK